ncbi:UDP-N-acetylmuramate--L-alanine ligase [Corynebacterium heidelbergense]|uniref:UDP-N-acetylmuramate--L-alanine ligase n=1 Tax=Corynebacterium heidelbergense TaxID=2055947 RepID=A0A364V6I9_9CORY|nr:UDP-N-acetylmuramate--L-alanine ligase [Corynebacterium heidelbergense]RAV32265.1 UDP-N-acetylmuramate--L-alanine ligase [Corynebacterium heidelbergense]
MSSQTPSPSNPAPVEADLTRVHMVGIGGAGMSGIARILLARGYAVSGSDMKDSRSILALRAAGAVVGIGHDETNLTLGGELPTVVVTSFAAIPQDNPELAAARQRGIPVVRRSDVLAMLLRSRRSFLLAGTHGKTSTTSMAVAALQQAGQDPSFAIGGQLNRAGTNAHHGTGDIFVAEADESDGSFLSYEPEVAVVTNIEPDHLDYFKTAEAYVDVFRAFAGRVQSGGALLLCLGDAGSAALAEALVRDGFPGPQEGRRVLGYGSVEAVRAHPEVPVIAAVQDISVTPTGTLSHVTFYDPSGAMRGADVEAAVSEGVAGTRTSGEAAAGTHTVALEVRIPGDHMVLNAVAAVAGSYVLGADIERAVAGVSAFDGVRRRFESHGSVAGVEVFDDYAHHPTEVEAVLTAARQRQGAGGGGRVLAVFQPHLYSRTMTFAEEFARALSLADQVFLLDIFGAREQPVEGVDSRIIGSNLSVPWEFVPEFVALPGRVAQHARPGDLVLTLGAGTVTMLADEIIRELAERAADSSAGEESPGVAAETPEESTR